MRGSLLFIKLVVLALPPAIVLWLAHLFWFDLWSELATGKSLAAWLSSWLIVVVIFLAITRWSPGEWVDQREEGVVKWFNGTKGFGFITRHNDEDVFVHFRSIRGRGHRTLHEGQSVRFEVIESDKGLQAEDVSVIGQD